MSDQKIIVKIGDVEFEAKDITITQPVSYFNERGFIRSVRSFTTFVTIRVDSEVLKTIVFNNAAKKQITKGNKKRSTRRKP
jgi:hypothetical protein